VSKSHGNSLHPVTRAALWQSFSWISVPYSKLSFLAICKFLLICPASAWIYSIFQFEDIYIFFNLGSTNLFSSVISCAPSNPASPLPPKNRVSSIYDIPQGDAPAQLVKPEASTELKDSNERKDNKKPEKNHGCDKDEVYLSELDICVTHPHPPAAPLPPKRVQSIYDIPQGDSPQAVSPLSKSDIQLRRKNGKKDNNKYGKEPKDHGCGKGELYLSELDICVPYNNCYPYGTTC